jgi:hypothetical protein
MFESSSESAGIKMKEAFLGVFGVRDDRADFCF